MSSIRHFQQVLRHSPLRAVLAQAADYAALTELVQATIDPRLSAGVSVVGWQEGRLSLLCPNSTRLSQWRYARRACMAQLRQQAGLATLNELHLALASAAATPPTPLPAKPRHLSPATRRLLLMAAKSLEDRELSLALGELASRDPDQ